MNINYKFDGKVWKYGGENPWFFITLPADIAAEIKTLAEPYKRGFGSVRVAVTIGADTWKTSIFPDKQSGSYVLPVKKEIRANSGLDDGTMTKITLIPELKL